jgi:signal transduction histidine kinase
MQSARSIVSRRVREREFWITQAAVILVTVLHVAVEAGALNGVTGHQGSFHHVPVVLYLLPVTYASLVYGFEGALLTSAWAGALALVNVPFWHAEAFDWVFEIAFVLVVVGVCAVTARPVELERAQRLRAERAARRLAILNALAGAELADDADLEALALSFARELISELGLGAFSMTLRRHDSPEPVVDIALSSTQSQASSGGEPVLVEVESGSMGGHAILSSRSVVGFAPDDEEFAATAVRQLSVRLINAALASQERAAMETYVRLVTSAQEAERKRISLELHDGPAQDLALLVRELDESAEVRGGPDLRGRAAAILDEIRRMARRQRPSALDVLGLRAALESTLGDLETADTRVVFETTGIERRLPPEVEEALYRIAQEAVRNAVRHSGGKAATVSLGFDGDWVRLKIIDDGEGFEPAAGIDALVMSGRMGVMGMAERAQLIGADFSIRRRRSSGTSIVVVWPGSGP